MFVQLLFIFQFGGKLISYNSECRSVNISQVVTEPTLIQRSHSLQQALSAGQYEELRTTDSDLVWEFVFATLQPDSRSAMRALLGFTPEQLEVRSCYIHCKEYSYFLKSSFKNNITY